MPEPVRLLELRDPAALRALGHPLRVRILEALRAPASAAGVARALGEARQNVNHHVKGLERAGLVRSVGERRKGNFVERLYQSSARTFLVSPRVCWADPRRSEALAEQHSLRALVDLGERVQRHAAGLLDRAAFDGDQIASAAVEAELGVATDADRAEFMKAYLAAVGPLLRRYGRREGARYRVALAVYPDPDDGTEQ